ncbi:oligosaccharide repeat unit polymerase [Anoxybacillus flavithermus]
MLKALILILLIIIPVYILKRFKNNRRGSILNLTLYPLIFAYLYLLFPSSFIEYSISAFGFRISEKSIIISNLLCIWYVIVFLFFYIISKDRTVVLIESKPEKITYIIGVFLSIIVSIVLIYILIYEAPQIIAVRDNRIEAFHIYVNEVFFKYKIGMLFNITVGSFLVFFWRKKINFVHFIPLILFILLDQTHGGRALTFFIIIILYVNYVVAKNKMYFKFILIGVSLLFLSGFLQRAVEGQTLESALFFLSGEFTNTRITTSYIIEYLSGNGNFFEYMLRSFMSLFPQQLSASILDPEPWYGSLVSQHMDYYGMGFAGNIVSEALYYGGIFFAIVSPVIIGLFYFLLERLAIYKKFPGYVFTMLLIAKTQDIFRTGFYETVPQYIYLMFSYLIFITLFEFKKKVIEFEK